MPLLVLADSTEGVVACICWVVRPERWRTTGSTGAGTVLSYVARCVLRSSSAAGKELATAVSTIVLPRNHWY